MEANSAYNLLEKYPDRVPIIIKCHEKTLDLVRTKFLVPNNFSLGELMVVVRRYLKNLRPSEALYTFFNGKMYPQCAMISQIFAVEQKNYHLTMILCKESVFG